MDGGTDGEERSPETATVGELLNFISTSDRYRSEKNLIAELAGWMQMDQRCNRCFGDIQVQQHGAGLNRVNQKQLALRNFPSFFSTEYMFRVSFKKYKIESMFYEPST